MLHVKNDVIAVGQKSKGCKRGKIQIECVPQCKIVTCCIPPVTHETGRNLLDNSAELDYLTHILIRCAF